MKYMNTCGPTCLLLGDGKSYLFYNVPLLLWSVLLDAAHFEDSQGLVGLNLHRVWVSVCYPLEVADGTLPLKESKLVANINDFVKAVLKVADCYGSMKRVSQFSKPRPCLTNLPGYRRPVALTNRRNLRWSTEPTIWLGRPRKRRMDHHSSR